MKPAVAPAPAAVARRISRPTSAVPRKSAVAKRKTLAEAAELLRRLNQPGFMRYGRPDDYGELREQK